MKFKRKLYCKDVFFSKKVKKRFLDSFDSYDLFADSHFVVLD